MHKWLVFIVLVVMGTGSLYAKGGGACIPINEIRTVKKAILTLDLNKDQKSKITMLEETLKEQIINIRSGIKRGEGGKLSALFDDSGFKRKAFIEIASGQNNKTSEVIATYFEKLYALLNPKQQKALIEKFERIEKKRQRKK